MIKKRWLQVAGFSAVVVIVGFWYFHKSGANEAGGAGGKFGRAMPVRTAVAQKGDMDVTLSALGTVTALNTATVKARVDGQLARILFKDGQLVKQGEVLAQIDPRPYQAAYDQSVGQLEKDKALLANAKLDLNRYNTLFKKDSIAGQQVDTQAALVQQYEGTVKTDQGIVDSNRLNLDFTKITAPISGRLGLRQLDVGNMIHGSDTTGLVVITQTQPIYVLFSIPADHINDVLDHQSKGNQKLVVEALDSSGRRVIAKGDLYSLDNQVDVTTSTVKAKAEFTNKDDKLFPNQFVNVRVHIETLHDTVLVPNSAIQRGSQGTFVYVVDADNKVTNQPVKLGPSSGETVAITEGLTPDTQVVIDGADKLRNGASVIVAPNKKPDASAPAAAKK